MKSDEPDPIVHVDKLPCFATIESKIENMREFSLRLNELIEAGYTLVNVETTYDHSFAIPQRRRIAYLASYPTRHSLFRA